MKSKQKQRENLNNLASQLANIVKNETFLVIFKHCATSVIAF